MAMSHSEELAKLRQSLDDAAHLIVEYGIVPGRQGHCRCEQCKRIAVQMHEAGYLSDHDKWWEDEHRPNERA